MKQIEDLIEMLGNENCTLNSALFKAQILAHKLREIELKSWVEHELRGYPSDADIPPYRILMITLYGNITNGYYSYNNRTLPIGHLDDDVRDTLTKCYVRDSISSIECWSEHKDTTISIPPESLEMLSKAIRSPYRVQDVWGRVGIGAEKGILADVRSRLLEFCLKLSDKIPSNTLEQNMAEKAKVIGANDIFRNAVFGDNVTIVVGSGNISSVKNNVHKGNFETLRKELSAAGICDEDLSLLDNAIQIDQNNNIVKSEQWGVEVSNWIGRMIAKAGSPIWEISKSTAANILATAISAYYGN